MLADSSSPDFTKISTIVIQKVRIAAVTSIGHVLIWSLRPLVDGPSTNGDILQDWISMKVDFLKLRLQEGQVSMSQDYERIVVLDPFWYDITAYITQSSETAQTIPARKHGKMLENYLLVDAECRTAAVGSYTFRCIECYVPLDQNICSK
jgi:hypothetical protein